LASVLNNPGYADYGDDEFLCRIAETNPVSVDSTKDWSDGDYGKVIGKRGRNISAIRTLLFAVNAKEGGKRARLEVIDRNE